jgi:hypothetical protein
VFGLTKLARQRGAKKAAALGVKLQHTQIERQNPSAVRLPITDSVVKGEFVVEASGQCSVLSRKAEFCMDLKHSDGRVENVVLGEDVFPDPHTRRADDMLKYPFAIEAGKRVEDFFIISMTDKKTNMPRSIPDELAKRGATAAQASFFVRTSVQVKGLGTRPETRSSITVLS